MSQMLEQQPGILIQHSSPHSIDGASFNHEQRESMGSLPIGLWLQFREEIVLHLDV
jgi:hypothetical protein